MHIVQAAFREHGANEASGSIGIVAVFAQVPEHHLMQAVMRDGSHQFGGLLVGQMAVAGADALLGGPGAFGVGIQKLRIIVGFQKERVRALQTVANEVGDKADVTDKAQLGVLVLDGKAHRVRRVVRHGKALDAQVLEFEGAAGLHKTPARGVAEVIFDALARERGDKNRDVPLLGENLQSGGVIAVFVGQQNAVERGGAEAGGLHAQGNLLGAQPGVDEHGGAIRGDHGAIPGTPAAEDGEAQHGADDAESAAGCKSCA